MSDSGPSKKDGACEKCGCFDWYPSGGCRTCRQIARQDRLLNPPPTPSSALVEWKFWKKVNKNGPVSEYRPDLGQCWLWTGGKKGKGYGVFSFMRGFGSVMAHRVSYELAKGPIPAELEIDHLCMVKPCVNPDHLEAVTSEENGRRAALAQGYAEAENLPRCISGHLQRKANTYEDSEGRLQCRICVAEEKIRQDKRARAYAKAEAKAIASSMQPVGWDLMKRWLPATWELLREIERATDASCEFGLRVLVGSPGIRAFEKMGFIEFIGDCVCVITESGRKVLHDPSIGAKAKEDSSSRDRTYGIKHEAKKLDETG